MAILIAIIIADLFYWLGQDKRDLVPELFGFWEIINYPALFFIQLTYPIDLDYGSDTGLIVWFSIGQCIQWAIIGVIYSMLRSKSLWRYLKEPPKRDAGTR